MELVFPGLGAIKFHCVKQEVLFQDGDVFFDHFIRALSLAQSTIEIEAYIFDLDDLGKKVLAELERAHHRGVRVRLLLDGVGASQWRYRDAQDCRRSGIDLRFFHALIWQRSDRSAWQSLSLRRIVKGFRKLNSRNHRKTCIIDGKTAFVGSMNITARHLASVHGGNAWRDTAVRIETDAVPFVQRAFEDAWSFSENYFTRWAKRLRGIPSQDSRAFYRQLLMNFQNAQQTIWITTPYFVPNRFIMRALTDATKRGVDVRLLVPKKSDFFGVQLAMHAFYMPLLKAGVRVFEYLPSMIHAKVPIIDDWVSVGSSNLDHRSLFHDLEADILLTDPENIASVKAQFLIDLKSSHEISIEEWRQRSWVRKALERLFFLFRSVL